MGQKQAKEFIDLSTKCTAPGVIFKEEIQTINNAKRNVVSWLPEDGEFKAIVIIAHGVIEHALCYYSLAHKLVANKYAVFAIDHVAHGKSDGVRGVIPDYRTLYSDFIEFANKIRSQYEDLPLFLFGHSMGTLVTILGVSGIRNVKAIVLSGPAIVSGPASSSPFGIRCLYPLTQTSAAVCLTSITATLDPRGVAAPLAASAVCSNDVFLKEIEQDPRRNQPYVTNKTAQQVLRAIRAAKEEVKRLTVPFFVFHGDLDQITLKQSSEYVFKNAATNVIYRKIHIFPNAKHEVHHESEEIASACMQMIVDYYDEMLVTDVLIASDEPTNSVNASSTGIKELQLTTTTATNAQGDEKDTV